jgi:hypothetical protein
MRRVLTSTLALALLIAGIPSAGIAALCASERGVHHSCCCHPHDAVAPDQGCCCDISDQKEEQTSSFVPQPPYQDSPPVQVALPVAAANHPLRPSDARFPSNATWQPPPGSAPLYLTVLQLRI